MVNGLYRRPTSGSAFMRPFAAANCNCITRHLMCDHQETDVVAAPADVAAPHATGMS